MKRTLISLIAVCAIGAAFAQSPPSGPHTDSSPANATSQPQSTGFKAGDRHSFDMADINHDGTLSIDELRQALNDPSGSPTRFKAYDRNGDGRISPDEWANARDEGSDPPPSQR